MAAGGSQRTGVVETGSRGQPTTPGSARLARPTQPKIQELTRALEEEVEKRPVTRRLLTHPGVGPLTALAYELVIGTAERFHNGKQIASYVGLVPTEESSGDRADWDTSASKATHCFVFYWSKLRKSRCAVHRSGAASFSIL